MESCPRSTKRALSPRITLRDALPRRDGRGAHWLTSLSAQFLFAFIRVIRGKKGLLEFVCKNFDSLIFLPPNLFAFPPVAVVGGLGSHIPASNFPAIILPDKVLACVYSSNSAKAR